jgi:hypothetical protein
MFFNLLIVTVLFIILLLVSIGAGRFIINSSFRLDSESVYFRIGSSFFVGIAFLVVCTRLGTAFSKDAKLSAYITIFIATVFCAGSYAKTMLDLQGLLSGRRLVPILGIFIILPIFLLLYWMPPGKLGLDPFSSIGTLHSVRYAWIANSIIERNDILIIPQNTAQSILAFISSSISFQTPYLHLFLWLYSAQIFLSLFIYGLICKLAGNARRGLLGVAVFMMGNSALSLTHVLTLDSGNPFLLNGYTDTILGVFSIFFLLIINENIKVTRSKIAIFFLSVLILVLNFFCAPQNILLFVIVPIILIIRRKYEKERDLFALSFWIMTILVSALISIPLGGMFTPQSLLSHIQYPGIMTPMGSGAKSGIQIHPGIPFHIGWLGQWEFGLTPLLSFASEFISSKLTLQGFLNKLVWSLEQILVTSVRVLFFVIVGLSLLVYKFRMPLYITKSKELLTLNTIGNFGLAFFLCGLVPTFFITLNGYKWELSRFLIPAVSIGSLGLALAVIYLADRKFLFKKYIIITALSLIFIGPVINFIGTASYNIVYLVKNDLYKSYFVEFIGRGPSTLD